MRRWPSGAAAATHVARDLLVMARSQCCGTAPKQPAATLEQPLGVEWCALSGKRLLRRCDSSSVAADITPQRRAAGAQPEPHQRLPQRRSASVTFDIVVRRQRAPRGAASGSTRLSPSAHSAPHARHSQGAPTPARRAAFASRDVRCMTAARFDPRGAAARPEARPQLLGICALSSCPGHRLRPPLMLHGIRLAVLHGSEALEAAAAPHRRHGLVDLCTACRAALCSAPGARVGSAASAPATSPNHSETFVYDPAPSKPQ